MPWTSIGQYGLGESAIDELCLESQKQKPFLGGAGQTTRKQDTEPPGAGSGGVARREIR